MFNKRLTIGDLSLLAELKKERVIVAFKRETGRGQKGLWIYP